MNIPRACKTLNLKQENSLCTRVRKYTNKYMSMICLVVLLIILLFVTDPSGKRDELMSFSTALGTLS